MTKQLIYLDYAAATPMDERVLAAMQPFFAAEYYNPSANYLAAMDVAEALQTARANVAHWLGARPSEVIFTAGGTEANNLAVQGVMRQFPEGNVVVSAIEHESVLAPAGLFDCRVALVDEQGMVDATKLTQLVDDYTVLVSVMYANNEVGTIEPIREIATELEKIREERRKAGNTYPLYFHTDAAQAANYLDLHAARLGVDMMTLNGGKIYGPKQSGALFVSSSVNLQPLILGGGQERGLRNGTENVAAAVGFATALEVAQTDRHEEAKRLQELQHYFFDQLEAAIPHATINGSRKKRLPNNVHVTISGIDNERVLIQLDEAGIMAAAGSACSASNEDPSHVLRAMGKSDDAAQSSLRFALGRATSQHDIDCTMSALKAFLN